jgi:hypothetical protein
VDRYILVENLKWFNVERDLLQSLLSNRSQYVSCKCGGILCSDTKESGSHPDLIQSGTADLFLRSNIGSLTIPPNRLLLCYQKKAHFHFPTDSFCSCYLFKPLVQLLKLIEERTSSCLNAVKIFPGVGRVKTSFSPCPFSSRAMRISYLGDYCQHIFFSLFISFSSTWNYCPIRVVE